MSGIIANVLRRRSTPTPQIIMKLITTSIGSYPRIGESRDHQRLRRAYGQRERNELSAIAFRDVERSVTEEIIQEQVQSGIDHVTDGLISWVDPISHIAGRLGGVSIKGLLRFFDTNFYFRQPLVTGKLRWKGPITLEAYTFAASASPKPIRAILTGPYTLAKLSVVKTPAYKKLDRLVAAYAECLSREVSALAKAGAPWIQIDEPAILKNPGEFVLLKDAFAELQTAKGSSELALVTYFGEAYPLYKKLHSLSADALGFDFTYAGRKLMETIRAQGADKPLGLGLVDGRNTRLESEGEVLTRLEKILPALKADRTFLTPSSGLEYLPRDKALAKLKLLGRVRSLFRSGTKAQEPALA
jgi:5-methyltetrahydropteroyltriglutamate--homocysteine methyltransferase